MWQQFFSFLASGGTFEKWHNIGLQCCKRAFAPWAFRTEWAIFISFGSPITIDQNYNVITLPMREIGRPLRESMICGLNA